MAGKKTTKKEAVVEENAIANPEVKEVIETVQSENTTTPVSEINPTEQLDTTVNNSEKDAEDGEEFKDEVMPIDVEKIAESIESVDTTINVEEKPIEEVVKETVAEIESIKKINDEIVASQSELASKIEENPESAEEYIKSEIKKAEDMKGKIEKIIKEAKVPVDNSRITTWWNGNGYGF